MDKVINITDFSLDSDGITLKSGYIKAFATDSVTLDFESDTIQIKLVGYSGETEIFSFGWYSNAKTIDLSKALYAQARYWQILVKNKNASSDTEDIIESITITIKNLWNIGTNEIFADGMPNVPETAIQKPYPLALWRVDGFSPNMPRHLLFPEIKPFIRPVPQYEYITVYSMNTKQDNFNNNGLAILTPISCLVTEEFNSGWNLSLEHPRDAHGKWKYLVEFNILKVLGQLFVIKSVTYTSKSVSVYAEHIFYQLNDAWIKPQTSIYGANGAEILRNIVSNATFERKVEDNIYRFECNSDLNSENAEVNMGAIVENKWQPVNATTPMDLILGSDGFTANFGGDLYRDNFYFSINKHMENHMENSFDIRMGLNLKKITKKSDISELCTHYTVYDKFGSGLSVFWLVHGGIPHHIVRSQTIDFGENYTETNFDLLGYEARKYFGQHMQPTISYEISLEDVKNSPDFVNFVNNPRYKVGDRGRIFDETLNVDFDAHITRTVKNGITGQTLEISFSNTGGFENMGMEHQGQSST